MARLLSTIGVVVFLTGCSGDGGTLAVTGEIEGHVIAVGSRVGGRVSEVVAAEGDRVSAGDVLVRIEDFEAKADVAAARAVLAQAEAGLAKLEAGPRPETIRAAEAAAEAARARYDEAVKGARSEEIEAARSKAEAARAEMEELRGDFERQSRLYEEDVVPFNVVDQVQHRLEAAENRYASARNELELLIAGTRDEQIVAAKAAYDAALAQLDELRHGSRVEDIAAARAARDLAAAQLERAQIALRETVVTSPINGIVESLDLRPGDIVKPGAVARVMDPDDLELTIYVSAALLGQLHVGQTLPFTTDAHGDTVFEGVVEFIANEGEFTPRNLQTEEDRVQQVFAVELATDSASGKLRPGMAATVHIGSA